MFGTRKWPINPGHQCHVGNVNQGILSVKCTPEGCLWFSRINYVPLSMHFFGQRQIIERENLIGSWQNGFAKYYWTYSSAIQTCFAGWWHPQSEVKAPEHVENDWKSLAPSKVVSAYRCIALVKMDFIIFNRLKKIGLVAHVDTKKLIKLLASILVIIIAVSVLLSLSLAFLLLLLNYYYYYYCLVAVIGCQSKSSNEKS